MNDADAMAPTEDEIRDVLLTIGHQRFGRVPGGMLVDHVLRVTADADFSVRTAAMEALVRRWEYAKRDGLVVAARPPRGAALGEYATRACGAAGRTGSTAPGRRKRGARPYRTLVESVAPLAGSCTCPDFIRGSLGVCKHLLVVLDHVHSSRARAARVEREQRAPRSSATAGALRWSPVRPLRGPGDRLAGLRWQPNGSSGAAGLAPMRRYLRDGSPEPAVLADLGQRLGLLRALAAFAARPPRAVAVEPAVEALIQDELERAERRMDCEHRAPAVLRELKSLSRKLYPYQREGVERIVRAGRLLLADDMGLGKTVQAAAACHALFHGGRVRRGILIVPASLKPQWHREWQATTDVPLAIVDGRPADRARQYRGLDAGFLVLNYELLLKDLPLVQRLAPDMVVLDEAQRIKNWATKSSLYVKSLTPRYRLVLTGTPMENRLEELASILDFVDDIALNPKWRLVPWHTSSEADGARGQSGARNLDTLRERLRPNTVRRLRQEVLAQLPPRTDTRVPVEMTPQQRLEHDELQQPIASLLSRAAKRPLTQAEFLRLMSLFTTQRMISNGLGQLRFDELWPTYSRVTEPDGSLLEGLFSPKLLELRRLLEDVVVAQGRKVVIFSQWRKMLRLADWSVQDVLRRARARAVFFTGAERTSQRTKAVVDFHDEPSVRVMFLTDAGGVGLNLQKAASCCVNLELPWNPAVLEQRIGRIYRLGQKRPIDVYNLVNEYGVEARIAGLVAAKRALFGAVFDGTSDEVRFDQAGGFLAQARALVDPTELEVPAAEPLEDAAELAAEPEPELVGAPERALDGEAREAAAPRAPLAAMAGGGAGRRGPLEIGPADISALFGEVRVARSPSGGLTLEASPQAAASLAALLSGVAQLLGQAAQAG
jgi:hypothetical protein